MILDIALFIVEDSILFPDNFESVEIYSVKCFCFIAPSCSESTSTAVITCLNTGLYPIYSRDNGVQLFSNGYLLENCRHKEIENAIKSVMNKNKNELRNAMLNNRTYVQREHSREKFSIEMDKFIDKALLNEDSK